MSKNRQATEDLLKALYKHRALISLIHQNGYAIEDGDNSSAITELHSYRTLWRPNTVDSDEVRLTQSLSSTLGLAVEEYVARDIDKDMGGYLDLIKRQIDGYQAAKRSAAYSDSETYLNQLSETVYNLIEHLAHAVKSTWYNIDSQFRYVQTIESKEREAQYLLESIKKLRNGLSIFNTTEMQRLAGSDAKLFRLLVSRLPNNIAIFRSEIVEVIERLKDLLFEMKEIQIQSRALQFVHDLFRKKGDESEVDEKFFPIEMINRIENRAVRAYPDVDAVVDQQLLEGIVTKLTSQRREEHEREVECIKVQLSETPTSEIVESAVGQAVTLFFERVAKKGEASVSDSRDLIPEEDVPISAEVWMFSVMARYNIMQDGDRKCFTLRRIAEQDHYFNGVHYVEDIFFKAVQE